MNRYIAQVKITLQLVYSHTKSEDKIKQECYMDWETQHLERHSHIAYELSQVSSITHL